MASKAIGRRQLLQGGLGALLSLMGHQALAELPTADNALAKGGDGLKSAQLRLGEMLIHYLASHRATSPKTDSKSDSKTDADDGANVVVSPASLAAIVAAVDLGGNQPMHAAIHRALGFKPGDPRKAASDLEALRQDVSAIIKQSDADAPLLLANLIAFERTVSPKQSARDRLSEADAEVLVDDLGRREVTDRINQWVKDKTRNLIPGIMDKIPEDIDFLGVNALYFKDKWQKPFVKSSTRREPFRTISGQSRVVDMMHTDAGKFRFRADDRFIAVELAYAHANFKLVVITTQAEPERLQDFAGVTGWLEGQGFAQKSGDVAMPKLKLSAMTELLPALDEFGLAQARRSPNALEAFSDKPLQIGRVIQLLELRVDEEGTEGAAVTAIPAPRSIASISETVHMIIDKPFLFALRDDRTGLVLFMGFVGAPKSVDAA